MSHLPYTGTLFNCCKRDSQLFLSPRLSVSVSDAVVQEGSPPGASLPCWLGTQETSKLSSILSVRSYRLTLATHPSALA